ncbi:hypothetical protein BCE_A0030 (plasmid) [Bacillus cereus ATCC 10987]|uniref:Uncharacterized protein n=1 Tax=Bacillus cereus (strain ATCC 10987 / NRS 248) TaxID=222523 RepID=Q74P64_BACC1|nr:hypothetical protein BCE_A0030 [Bacillus cereus ATCC 10987]
MNRCEGRGNSYESNKRKCYLKCVIFTYSIILLLKKYKEYKGKLFVL